MSPALRGVVTALLILTAVLGWLPAALIGANLLTQLLTGWRESDEIIQGCETNIYCAESGTFYWTLLLCFIVWPVAWGLLFWVLRRRDAGPS